MMDYLKKAMLIGIGLAAATREKVEEYIQELVKKGEISEKEGKELLNDLLERSKKMKDEMEKKVENIVADTLSRLNIPTKKQRLIDVLAQNGCGFAPLSPLQQVSPHFCRHAEIRLRRCRLPSQCAAIS
jgi:polyhydroxyalkanoate synthesis regulator phasin